MKSINKLHKLSIATACAVGLLACSDKDISSQNITQEVPQTVNKQANFVHKTDYLTRDIQDEVFYFVLPDRFHNANNKNDNGDASKPISYGGLDINSKWAFHGGDIAGIEAKLDYIEGLGVTAIWMTPILRNRAVQNDGFGYHGNWVVDFTEIDPHFGSNDDLKSLIEAAHKRDIKIFFDIITNHTADVIKYEECHNPEGKLLLGKQKGCDFIDSAAQHSGEKHTPFVLETEKNVKVPAWLNDPKYYNNRGDSNFDDESTVKGDFVGLDDIDTAQVEVITGLTDVFTNLMTEFRPDGFRVSSAKQVDAEFWQSFSPAITEHAISIGLPEFFMFGDVSDDNSVGQSKFTTIGKLRSVVDYSFALSAHDVVFSNENVGLLHDLINNDDYYRDSDSSPNELVNFLSNHDLGRAGHFIETGLPKISEQEKIARSKLGHALMYFSRGIPSVYYGDEQGFTGDGGNVDAREDMDPSKVDVYNDNNLLGTTNTTSNSNFDIEHPLYTDLSALANIRHAHKSLRQGEHVNRLLDESKSLYGFSRILPDDMIDHLVVFNFSTQQQQTSMGVGMLEYKELAKDENSKVELSGDQLMLDIAPLSYILLQSNIPVAKSFIDDINLLTHYQEHGRIYLSFGLTFNNPEQFNFAQIKLYSIDEEGQKNLLSYDTTSPYRAILLPEQFAQLSKIEVVADNFQGRRKTKMFELSK